MKYRIPVLLIASASLALSCAKTLPAGEAEGCCVVELQAGFGDQTKATVTQSGVSAWSAGDQIAVLTTSAALKTMTLASVNAGIASFNGAFAPGESPTDIAVFPATALQSVAGSTVTISYPSSYSYSDNAMNAPMTALIDGGVLSFTNVGGIISIPCAEVPEEAAKFFIAAVGQKISGSFEVQEASTMTVSTTSMSGNSKVSVSFVNDGLAKTFNVPVPTGTYTSIYAAFEDASGNNISEWEVLNNTTVSRADMFVRPRPQNMMRVASYNIRFSKSEEDYTLPNDARKWDARKLVVPSALSNRHIDLMGSQENTFGQINDILSGWTGHNWLGKSNWDNEYSPSNYTDEVAAIYYSSAISVVESGTIWFDYSIDYDKRCCNWAKLSYGGSQFYIFNTHLQVGTDDKYRVRRVAQATAVLTEIKKVSSTYPVILTGDFNTTIATENDAVKYLVDEGTMKDARALVANPHGSYGSLHYFQPENPCTKRVDYVLVNDKVNVHSFWIDNSQQKTQAWESDHHPVVVDISF